MKLAFENLSLTLRGRDVLKDVTGAFPTGKMTVILGANGAGKSSLLSCLAGLRQPQSGTVVLGDRNLGDWTDNERARKLGLLPQKADIHWNVDVRTVVGLGRLPHRGRWGLSDRDRSAIEEALQTTDCIDIADRHAQRLSGGEQSRVLLARVFAGEPDWLLADEPLASLDPAHQFDIVEQLRSYAAKGAGVITVLHDITLAARFADEVLIMKDGTILAQGSASDVLTPENLAAAYGVEIESLHTDTGESVLIPVSRLSAN
ncbi:MAG: ABC transporter ATP-binding protein [Pseudomonadota bacterium]